MRILVPGDKSVDFHADVFYGHGNNIVNYWMPITSVYGNNSMFVLTEEDSKNLIKETKKLKEGVIDFNKKCHMASKPLEINYGQMLELTLVHFMEQFLMMRMIHVFLLTLGMVVDNDDVGLKDQSFFITDRKNHTKK